MRRRLRGVVVALATVALVATMSITTIRPARADASQFMMGSGTYGPNATVMIELGALTRDCDFIYTTSDIYVVPTGSVSSGGSLSDVSGTPNTVTSALLGSALIDEVIGFTGPSGSIPEGTYDVVEDTCQNGVMDGSDSILSNAFTVEFPSGVPPLPSAAIANMKASAEQQRDHWTQAAAAYSALLTAYLGYSLWSDARNIAGFYLTYVCLFLPPNPDPNMPITVYCPTVGVPDLVRLKLAVVKTIIDKAAHYNGIAADPPDFDYQDPSLPGATDTFEPVLGDTVEEALIAHMDQVAQDEALAEAYLGAMEKYQGAEIDDEPAVALMHARSMQDYAIALRDSQSAQAGSLNMLLSRLGSRVNVDNELRDLGASRDRLAADGFTADEERQLRNLGLDDAALASLRENFVDEFDADHPFANITAMANSMIDANNRMGAAWVQVHNELVPVVSELEAVVAADETLTAYPVVDARGPYSGRTGTPVTLTATCDDCATIAWDLDGDGAHDDATGDSVSHEFAFGSHVIGVVGTNPAGQQSTDTARVNVSTSNRAPTHSAPSPALGTVEVPIGATQDFAVTVRDSDSADVLTTTWTLDGVVVGDGAAATVTAAEGPAVVQVVTTDPSGAKASNQWLLLGVHPDEDADGWHANIDCDDTSADVNPGANEVPGNGIDDDCDPATPDTGPPTAAFDWVPAPAIVGEEVTFVDGSTDPDGPVASWAWDFGDGTTATEQERVHTFGTVGSHDVTLSITDSDGLEDDLTRQVVVTARPVASFTHEPATPNSGEAVTFTSTSTDADGIAGLEWDFSYDGVTFSTDSTEVSPTHTFTGSATVALRVTDTLGAVSELTSREIGITGPPVAAFNPRPANGGTNMALVPHGASIAGYSSAASTTYAATEMIDVDYPSGVLGWRTATGLNSNQWAVVDLGAQYLVDRIKVKPAGSNSYRPAQVNLALSTTGAGSGYGTVFGGELANSSDLQELELATPTEGRWLRYEAVNNRGGTYITTDVLEAWTGQVGDATVTFQDLSSDPDGDDDIASWGWDFGDGTTSAEASPTHTYAAPGVYMVVLTVTDSSGNRATRSLQQTVIETPVTTDFTVPVNAREGVGSSFTNTSTVPGSTAIVDRVWNWGDGGVTTHSVSSSRSYADDGTYDVTLTQTDSYGFTTSATLQVEVANQPPTASMPATHTSWVDQELPFNNLTVSDPSTVDRASLHCVLDHGDGSPATEVENCRNTDVRIPHTYTEAGTYTVTLTVTDKDGGQVVRTSEVTVSRLPVHVVANAVPGTARGGSVDVRATVRDPREWTPMEGVAVVLEVDGASVTVTSDATGEVTARLPFAGPEGELSATIAQTRLRDGIVRTAELTTAQRPPGDVFFIVDESGSMGTYQQRVRENLVAMSEQLAASLDHQIGVAGLPTSNHDLFVKMPPTNDLDDAITGANGLGTANGGELGIDGIILAAEPSVGWRPSVGKCLVLIGDEPAQRRGGTTDEMAHRALADAGIVLYSIININDATLPYQELATQSGGGFFDINAFRTDPGPVLQTLLDNCSSAIVERPDLNVTVDDGVTEVEEGATMTYTVTVANTGPIDATGVVATATLPTGLEFVSASDGGTHDAGTITWPAATQAGESSSTRTFTVKVTGRPGDTVEVGARVADDGAGGEDVTPGNNVDSDIDSIVAAPTPEPSDTPTPEPSETPTPDPDATVTATATATTTVTATATPTVTTSPRVTATATATATTTATATATPTTTATATRTAKPDPGPTVTATKTAKPKPQDLYETPGYHESGGRKWMTVCEPYSITHRCWTYIWGTQIKGVPGSYHKVNGWVFNNLTYMASPRSTWAGNPLGNTGSWVDDEGRGWRTECETAVSGRNGCRSYVTTKVLDQTPDGIRYVLAERFNNIVRFTIR